VSADARAPARDRGPTVLALSAACAGIVFAVLLGSGVTISEVFLFIGFQGAYALVPGLLSSLALLGRPRSLLDTLAIAWPLGLAAQIGFFVLAAAVGQRWLFVVFPGVFVILAAPLLWRRRAKLLASWRASLRRTVAPRAAIAVLLMTVGASVVVFVALFAPSPLAGEIHSVRYYPDLIANVSLAAELLHHWPFASPSVAGVALHYNIFTNVDMAATAQVTHLELVTIVMRLQPTFLIGVIAVQLFVLGRKVGGSVAAGLIALAIGLFAGELNFSQVRLAGGGIPALGGLYSASYQIGAVFFLGILIVLVDRLWPARTDPRAHHWLALGVLSLGATGAKVSILPVIAGGLALFAARQLVMRRRVPVRASGVVDVGVIDVGGLLIVLAAGAIGYVLIYRGGGHGQSFGALDFLSYTGFASIYRHASHSATYALVACVAAVVALCGLLASLVGVVFVRDRWWPRGNSSSPDCLLMCMLAASLVLFVLFAVPGDSQVYYVVYGFLAASVVSAEGVSAVMRVQRLSSGKLVRAGLCCVLGALIVILALRAERATVALVPAYAFLACVVALSATGLRVRARKFTTSMRSDALAFGAVLVICLTAISETFEQTAPAIGDWLRGTPAFAASSADPNRGITAGLLHGLLWLREHTRPSAVIAVNYHEIDGGGANYFYYSAFSERRVFLESWEETPQGYEYLALNKSGNPFPRLLAINNAAVLHGSPAAISLLRDRYGVRYIVIDRVYGDPSPSLARLARVVYANKAVSIFRID
jgi:hypothetical protein